MSPHIFITFPICVSHQDGAIIFVLITLRNKLVRNRQTQQINKIGHKLQGVLCKVRQDDMFRST